MDRQEYKKGEGPTRLVLAYPPEDYQYKSTKNYGHCYIDIERKTKNEIAKMNISGGLGITGFFLFRFRLNNHLRYRF